MGRAGGGGHSGGHSSGGHSSSRILLALAVATEPGLVPVIQDQVLVVDIIPIHLEITIIMDQRMLVDVFMAVVVFQESQVLLLQLYL